MKLENILEAAKPRIPFWVVAWVFLFTLINREEGRRLIAELVAKIEENIRKTNELLQKSEEALRKSDEVLKMTMGS